jgi:ribonuclease HII
MVYGAAFCALSNGAALAKAAYADSKTLTEEKREHLFEQLQADAAMGWMVDSISAAELSAKMLRRQALPATAARRHAHARAPQRKVQPERHQL